MIELENLSKTYDQFSAVQSINLRIERAEIFGLLGPNGAGKTTTIRMLMGILVPTTGTAKIFGMDCHRDRAQIMRRVGYLPDTPVLMDYLRGREILEFIGEMHGQSKGEARFKAQSLLKEMDLQEATEEFAVNYSLGMKKKLGLAMALMHDPDILILDEPINGLDPRAALHIQQLIRQAALNGKTIILSTHLLDMAEKLCTRVGILHQGKLVAAEEISILKQKLAPGGSLEEVFLKLTETSQ